MNSARSQQNALPCAEGVHGHPVISSFPPPYCLHNEIVLENLKEKGTRNARNQAGKTQGTPDKQAPVQSQEHSPAAPREAEMGPGVILLNYLHVFLFTGAQQLDLFQECLLKYCPFIVLLPVSEDQFSPKDFQEVALACNFPWMPILQNNVPCHKEPLCSRYFHLLLPNFKCHSSSFCSIYKTHQCVVASQLINPEASLVWVFRRTRRHLVPKSPWRRSVLGSLGQDKAPAVPGCESFAVLPVYTPLVVTDSSIMFSHTSQLSRNRAMHI